MLVFLGKIIEDSPAIAGESADHRLVIDIRRLPWPPERQPEIGAEEIHF